MFMEKNAKLLSGFVANIGRVSLYVLCVHTIDLLCLHPDRNKTLVNLLIHLVLTIMVAFVMDFILNYIRGKKRKWIIK